MQVGRLERQLSVQRWPAWQVGVGTGAHLGPQCKEALLQRQAHGRLVLRQSAPEGAGHVLDHEQLVHIDPSGRQRDRNAVLLALQGALRRGHGVQAALADHDVLEDRRAGPEVPLIVVPLPRLPFERVQTLAMGVQQTVLKPAGSSRRLCPHVAS